MKIAIDVTRAVVERAGIGRYTREATQNLLKIDKENEYLIFSTHYRNSKEKTAIFNSFKTPNSRLFRFRLAGRVKSILWGFPVNWLKFILKPQADVLLAPSLLEAGLGFKVPQVVIIYDMTTFLFPSHRGKRSAGFLNKRTAKVCRKAKSIISISCSTEKDLLRFIHIPATKVKTIYPGLSALDKPSSHLPEGLTKGKYILAVGTVEPRKNLIGLFKAYSLLPESTRQKFPLVVAGGKGWRDSTIFEAANPLVEEGTLKMLGFVDDASLSKLYKEAKIFVYPSFYEGFGLPIIEGLSLGAPVITSNISSMPEASGDAAVLVDPNSPKSIYLGIKKILDSETLAKKLSAAGPRQAEKFSWEKNARETLEELKKAVV